MNPIPLFGTGLKSISEVVTSQKRTNVFYSMRDDNDRSGVFVRRTPGLSTVLTLDTAPIRGMHRVGSRVIAVAGSTVRDITSAGVVTNSGSISTSVGPVSICDDSSHVLIADGTQGRVMSGGATAAIVDANYPQTATSAAFLDSIFVVAVPNSREFRLSALLDPTTWTPLVFGTKEGSSDNLVAVDALNGLLILWGSANTEFWQNVGTSPNPFQRINGASQAWGLFAPESRAKIGNRMYFLGLSGESSLQVLRITGYTPEPISTEDVDNFISKLSVPEQAVASVYSVDGHTMYQLSWEADDVSLLYDTTTGVWSETQSSRFVGPTLHTGRHLTNYSVSTAAGEVWTCDSTTGTVYRVDPTVFRDNGLPSQITLCTRHIRASGNTISLSQVYFDFDFSQWTTMPTVAVEVSKDGGMTFGPQKILQFTPTKQQTSRAVLRRLGSAKDFVLRITSIANVQFILGESAAVIEVDDE